tara:strand:+ start:244 stop:537 length:294 start_codon:yes stop_codon:yes gene_type:complete
MSRLEKKAQEEDNQKFVSKKMGFFIYLPCWIPIILAFFLLTMGMASEASPYIVMGSMLALVCGSLGQMREKIIQQNQAIKSLQENLNEIDSGPDRDS